ncbi:RNA polymerase sigma factor [Actinomadura keratinilytica]|jgi:RNA polymerase sigma-70 factor (ECF subfamily)|uniref:RNA polymerase sigma factor n=1 Tax=Actinomadura keratinilytica TaxID=547461 RepID=A0ABP7YJ97_9ACTN
MSRRGRSRPADPHDQGLEAALHAAKAGDEAAFRLLYRDLQPRLLRYLRALVGAEAEDVAGEAWLQIARDIGSFEGDYDRFRGWASTVARHRALDHLRRVSRRPDTSAPIDELGDLVGGDDTERDALARLSTDAAVALISGLPQDQAEAVLLRVVVGLDAREAGRVLGKRPGAVRTAAYRGLHRLAERLADPSPGEPAGEPAGGTSVDAGRRRRALRARRAVGPAEERRGPSAGKA